MDDIVCLKLGHPSGFSREYSAMVQLVNAGAAQGGFADRLNSATVLQADCCEQVTGYLKRVSLPNSARVLAIIRQQPTTVEALSDCLSAGLTDFLFEPVALAELNVRLRRMVQSGRVQSPPSRDFLMIGESATLAQVAMRILQVARTDVPVVVTGETGSGKELVARAIHYQSRRKAHPFLPVNCGALPDHLFENEVFGHTKGAYTDADSGCGGLVAEADGGTLFLDEIDALSPQAQIKLLRFVQFGEYRPLGSARSFAANVRCIAATNTMLMQLVAQGRFREDLLHRLNVVNISVPPLRDRIEDIPSLARYFIEKYTHECPFSSPRLSDAAVAALMGYGWPGNVRELESAVRRALIFAESEELRPADFAISCADARIASDTDELSFQEAKARLIEQFEKQFLTNLMRHHAGNVSRASRAARTPRRCLQRLLQKYGLRGGIAMAG